jgi:hypothetical protein
LGDEGWRKREEEGLYTLDLHCTNSSRIAVHIVLVVSGPRGHARALSACEPSNAGLNAVTTKPHHFFSRLYFFEEAERKHTHVRYPKCFGTQLHFQFVVREGEEERKKATYIAQQLPLIVSTFSAFSRSRTPPTSQG